MAEQIEDQLSVTEDGLEVPEWLQGHVGKFEIRTPNVTGEFTTTDLGLGEYCEALSAVPNAGDYHDDLDEGQMAMSKPGARERVYQIVDERDGGEE